METIVSMIPAISDSAYASLGFFWKAGWAFVLGYTISAMIQAFVPRRRLAENLGEAGPRSIGIATAFGALSSSCSFAALAAARTLVAKGAHFIATVAFMFASTNLVIELGILIYIFLGFEFLMAELVGGIVLIAISSVLMRGTLPREWAEAARRRVEKHATEATEDFSWRERIRSADGWNRVGRNFFAEWGMVWEEILIGFTIAGIIATLVPQSFWEAIFLTGYTETLPAWLIAVENALVGPFVAAATFIGSMGNIPLATVLNANGVLFAGIMAFIYSDLIVPPLVMVNRKYYGTRIALYIALIMYISMVSTALILNGAFAWFGITPESRRVVEEVTRIKIDYTFYLNLGFVLVSLGMAWLAYRYRRARREQSAGGHDHDHGGDAGVSLKRIVVYLCAAWLAAGLLLAAVVRGSS